MQVKNLRGQKASLEDQLRSAHRQHVRSDGPAPDRHIQFMLDDKVRVCVCARTRFCVCACVWICSLEAF